MFVNVFTGSVFSDNIFNCKQDLEEYVKEINTIKSIKIIDGGI